MTQAWWCYSSFSDLYRATEGRKPSHEEEQELSKMSQTQKNEWVTEHVCKSRGKYIALDQGNGYLAFGTFHRFVYGFAENPLPVEDNGRATYELLSPYGGKHGITIHRSGNNYHITAWWNNGDLDIGRTSVDINGQGQVNNSHTHTDGHGKDIAYNWQTGQWQEKP
ncbi:MAG: hypothetical protein J0L96_08145 [Anaerolineae bacterium]|nr:hypothetical protein [Anaerolineae bacterium]